MENYKFIRQVGEGSYGKVNLARSPDGKDVVVKVIDTRRMNNKEKKAAMNEVKVLSSLKHPYVVRYYDSFLTAGKLCIVMAFAEKGDLYARIKQARNGRPIPPEQVLEWFTQAVLALKYLHDLRILHRDLKSQNMFLTSEERLKVGDFGISRMLNGTVAFARTMIGTPYYMSPEVCSERPYSWATDIWAMGCVLFELYQLRVPFEASSIRELMQKIVRGAIPRATKAPTAAQQLCADMMARDSTRRPSAAQILERPLIQDQIRVMLKQHSTGSVQGEEPAPALAARPPPARPGEVLQPVQPVAQAEPPRTPNIPPRAPSPMRRLVSDPAFPRARSPRVGQIGLPPKLHREPSAPVLLNGRIAHPGCASPRPGGPSPRGDVPPSPRWARPQCASPRWGVPPSPRAVPPSPRAPSPGRCASPARGCSPRRYEPYAGYHDPGDWYQRAMGLLR